MTKMSGRVPSCCVVLFLSLTCVSAVKRLDSINDLKKINFGQSVPKHSLILLYWFANTVDIVNNNFIQLTFDLDRGDYGSHYYGNYERLLDALPGGYRYYTVGNLYQDTSVQLPDYVANPHSEYVGQNRDRIIISARKLFKRGGLLQRIDQVYITQHYETPNHQRTPYDPDHTYQITTNLLRQIQEFSGRDNQLLYLRNQFGSNANIDHIRNTWGDLACLGLFLFIVIKKRSVNPPNRTENRQNHQNDNTAWALALIFAMFAVYIFIQFLLVRESR